MSSVRRRAAIISLLVISLIGVSDVSQARQRRSTMPVPAASSVTFDTDTDLITIELVAMTQADLEGAAVTAVEVQTRHGGRKWVVASRVPVADANRPITVAARSTSSSPPMALEHGDTWRVRVRTVSKKRRSTFSEVTSARISDSQPSATAGDATAIDVTWAPHPFAGAVSYDVAVRPDGVAAMCVPSTDLVTTETRVTELGDECGGPVAPDTTHFIDVRTNLSGAASVVTSAAPVRTPPAPTPAGCVGPQRFCTVYPDAFVTTEAGAAELGRAVGSPFVVNGVNLKRTVYVKQVGDQEVNQACQRTDATTGRCTGEVAAPPTWASLEELHQLATDPSTQGFNTVRLVLDWAWLQYDDDNDPTTPPVFDQDRFADLDTIIAEADANGLSVILSAIHLRRAPDACNEHQRMHGAVHNVPSWAWNAVGLVPPANCVVDTAVYNRAIDDVLRLPATTDYLRELFRRYAPDTALGRSVIAVDLVNEPSGGDATPGQTAVAEFESILAAYEQLLGSGDGGIRRIDDTTVVATPVILEAPHGDVSLDPLDHDNDPSTAPRNVDLTRISHIGHPGDPGYLNVIFSYHDFFGGLVGGAGCADGYTARGYTSPTCQRQLWNVNTTGADIYPAADADRIRSERTAHLDRHLDWLAPAALPLYIGEYGITNQCHWRAGSYPAGDDPQARTTRYAEDSWAIFGGSEPGAIGRTYWSNGAWDHMALRYQSATGQPSQNCDGIADADPVEYPVARYSYLPAASVLARGPGGGAPDA